METKVTLPTMKEITNNYLYGQENTPTEEERLDIEKIFSRKERKLYVDVNKFMNKQNGPGRFVTAANFPFIGMFFNPDNYYATTDHEVLKIASAFKNLERDRRYTKAEIANMLKRGWASKTLGLYDDGQDDVLERAYIWNTTAFKISNDAKFCIDKNGNRFIKNFAILPRSNRKGPKYEKWYALLGYKNENKKNQLILY